MKDGAPLSVFNASDGEWRASLQSIGKRGAALTLQANLRPPKPEPGPWLLFAPVKRAATDLILVKAVELGVERIQPILTRRTNAERINHDRFASLAIEAAEQCERLSLPTISEVKPFESVLAEWPTDRLLFIADEAGRRERESSIPSPHAATLSMARGRPWALAVGPEGGWEQGELDAFRDSAFVTFIAMGPRVLRAETAALAGLAVLQALIGDW